MNIHNVRFVKSAVKPSDFIRDGLPQIVFSGKSNVGKSSVINKLLNHNNFARVGASPGKTVHVNSFHVDDTSFFVDLPGYGYAKVSKSERDRWGRLMEEFFASPDRITLGVMIVDSRNKPTADDVTMARWFMETSCPFIIVANKIDKVKKSEIKGNIELIKKVLGLDDDIEVVPFSSKDGTNRDRLLSIIENAVRM